MENVRRTLALYTYRVCPAALVVYVIAALVFWGTVYAGYGMDAIVLQSCLAVNFFVGVFALVLYMDGRREALAGEHEG